LKKTIIKIISGLMIIAVGLFVEVTYDKDSHNVAAAILVGGAEPSDLAEAALAGQAAPQEGASHVGTDYGKGTMQAPVGTQEPTSDNVVIKLHRIDYSGMYALPDQVTLQDDLVVFIDGRAVSSNRVASAGVGDRIDVFDSQVGSVVTVKISKRISGN
jgi:hypothetical protein